MDTVISENLSGPRRIRVGRLETRRARLLQNSESSLQIGKCKNKQKI
jgi:hypothetical protein